MYISLLLQYVQRLGGKEDVTRSSHSQWGQRASVRNYQYWSMVQENAFPLSLNALLRGSCSPQQVAGGQALTELEQQHVRTCSKNSSQLFSFYSTVLSSSEILVVSYQPKWNHFIQNCVTILCTPWLTSLEIQQLSGYFMNCCITHQNNWSNLQHAVENVLFKRRARLQNNRALGAST